MSDGNTSYWQRQLEEFEAFCQTTAFGALQKTLAADLAGVEQSILLLPPVTDADRAEALKLFGRREELLRQQTIFEEARAILKDKIESSLNPEQ